MKKAKEQFIAHGYFVVSNSIHYFVQISEDGEMARLQIKDKVTDWFQIDFVETDEVGDLRAFIDINGYNVPIEQVMRLDKPVSRDLSVCCICNGNYVGYGNNAAPIKDDGECCDGCNYDTVVPARIGGILN